jgi:predicted ATPase
MAGCLVHLLRQEYELVQEQAEALLEQGSHEKFSFLKAWGGIFLGRAQVANGQASEGRANLLQGLAASQEIGQKSNATFGLAMLAEVSASAQDRLDLLAEAKEIMAKTGERFYEAEIYRLQGELYLKQGADSAAAEACFQHALEIARRQEAKSLELRAANSLARLRKWQGRTDEARLLLAEVYDWFTEGFDTADLIDARGLLDELKCDVHQIMPAA